MRKMCLSLLCVVLAFGLILPITASADTGPKPSVTIKISGLSGEAVYGTLLSVSDSTGPYSVAGLHEDMDDCIERADEIGRKFLDYQDGDGLYYLQYYDDCTDGEFYWGYYPPQNFKLLLYFPDRDEFIVTDEVYSRYAFKSVFTCNASEPLTLSESPNFTDEASSAAARFALTLIIEIALAFLFGFKAKKQLLLLLGVNFATQLGLNLALGFTVYKYGGFAEMGLYLLLELIIFIIEAAVYAAFLNRLGGEQPKKRHPVLYAFIANAASFGIGLIFTDTFSRIF